MEHDADRVLYGVKFPIDFGPDVSTATHYPVRLKCKLAKIADARHRYLPLLSLAGRIEALADYSCGCSQKVGDFYIGKPRDAQLASLCARIGRLHILK